MAAKVATKSTEDDWADDDPDWKDQPAPMQQREDKYIPDNFSRGVLDSMFAGKEGNIFGAPDAIDAGIKGGLGFMKGAVADIPSSIGGGLSSIAHAIAHPINTARDLPSNIMDAGRSMRDTTMQAGSHPEEFGEMMGQITGQPIATEGLINGVPKIPSAVKAGIQSIPSGIRSPIGRVTEAVGSGMAKYQPISALIPNMVNMRATRMIERLTGRQVTKLGQWLQDNPKSVKNLTPEQIQTVVGEIVPDAEYSESGTGLANKQPGLNGIADRLRIGGKK